MIKASNILKFSFSSKLKQAVKGMHELHSLDLEKHQYIVKQGETIFHQNNYNKVVLNIVENIETFKRTLGQESEIVNKEMFTLEDNSGKKLVLRPEATAPLVRMICAQNKIPDLPLKYYYHGPMFRYERPQLGRQRQFYQIGVENLGLTDYLADIEVIYLGHQFLSNIFSQNSESSQNFKLSINTLGDQKTRTEYNKALTSYYNQSNIYENLSNLSKLRLDRKNPLRIFDSKEEKDIEISQNAPKIHEFLTPESQKTYKNIKEGLDLIGIQYEEDHKLVRGLDYYNDICFEFKDVSREDKSQGTLLAGGRYDLLGSQLIGPQVKIPAVGWAAGIERISLKLDNFSPQKKIKIGLIPWFDKTPEESVEKQIKNFSLRCLKLCNDQLQYYNNQQPNQEVSVQLITQYKKSRKSFSYLDKENFDYAIIVGEEEIKNNQITIKDLKKRENQTINFEDFSPLNYFI